MLRFSIYQNYFKNFILKGLNFAKVFTHKIDLKFAFFFYFVEYLLKKIVFYSKLKELNKWTKLRVLKGKLLFPTNSLKNCSQSINHSVILSITIKN